jgi:cation transport protein ChaC
VNERPLPKEASAGDLWVFGYGSLMWRPGFAFIERRKATLGGWRRRLCIYSHVYRGTPERPGLVLGLDRGGSCPGVGFRVEASYREATIRYLRERELMGGAYGVYHERRARIAFSEGDSAEALTYVADRLHRQYAGSLSRAEMLTIVRRSVGASGPNADYVTATSEHLRELGIVDRDLEWLTVQLRGA